ncbi:MAG: GNAT family N-acetyltransferase [Streptosporangiaceae bacterium]
MPTRQLPGQSSLEHLKNQARALQRQVRAADPQATATVRQFHPRFARAAAGSPELASFPLTAAQLVIARQYGFASWPRLRQHAEVVIRPVTSPRELARAFELAGARTAPALAQDRYFLDLARRFHDDRPLLLAAELRGQVIGAAFAFRPHGPGDREATLRNVTVLRPHQGQGIERRLVEAIEQAAASLGVISVNLGGATGDERDFYLALGYHGRHAGGLMSKQLPRPRRPPAGPRPLP